MKISNPTAEKFATNVKGGETEAQIAINAFTFQAMSGLNLYKDLILAIVRELSCNAYDAHVMAGTSDIPFQIHLPTISEPHFGIRDYGIGLDDDGVRYTYMTLFDSTKRDDVKQIGAWGLGSKSPLGYTDNFTISSFKDGIKRIYTVYKAANGIPSVKFLAECETDEANGLEIIVPVVNSFDMDRFKDAAKTALKHFPVIPTFNCAIDIKPDTYIEENIIDGVHYASGYNSYVIHGCIQYPITGSLLLKREHNDLSFLLNAGLVINMPSGSVDYSLSREELSYVDKTVDNIVAKLYEVKEALLPKALLKLEGLNDWDKYIAVERLCDSKLYKGLSAELRKVSRLHELADENYQKQDPKFSMVVTMPCNQYKVKPRGTVLTVAGSYPVIHDEPTQRPILINDTGKTTGVANIIKHNTYFLTRGMPHDYSRIKVFHGDVNKVKQMYVDYYGGHPEIILLSSLQKPVREKRESVKGKEVCRSYDGSKFSSNGQDVSYTVGTFNKIAYTLLKGYKPTIKVGGVDTTYNIDTILGVVSGYAVVGVNKIAYDEMVALGGDHVDLVLAATASVLQMVSDIKNGVFVIKKYTRRMECLIPTLNKYENNRFQVVTGKTIDIVQLGRYYRAAKELMMVEEQRFLSDTIDNETKKGLDDERHMKAKYPLAFQYDKYTDTLMTSEINELEYYIKAKAAGESK